MNKILPPRPPVNIKLYQTFYITFQTFILQLTAIKNILKWSNCYQQKLLKKFNFSATMPDILNLYFMMKNVI